MPAKKKPTTTPRPPRQARHYPTLREWLAGEANVEGIRRILEDPVFACLCHYICDSSDVAAADINANPDAVIRKAFFAAGLKAFPQMMATFATKAIRHSDPMPYEYIHPETQ